MTIYSFLLLSSLTTAYAGNLQRHRLQKSIVPSAINHNGDECSCSNTKFTFRLDFSQDCTVDNIQENAGIDSTYCIIDNANTAEEPVRKLQSTTPVEITSVEFLEFARGSMEVMYRDDSYMNARLVDGDTVTFYSSSSYLPVVSTDEQDEYIPGGVSLIITGMTEDGNEVRNRFYWLYDEVVTDCLENLFLPGIYEGDAIGWVVVDEVSGPWPQFCPAASATSPTITPRTFTPTVSPASSSKSNKDAQSSKSSKNSVTEFTKSGKVEMDETRFGKSSKSSSDSMSYSISMSVSPSDALTSSAKSGKPNETDVHAKADQRSTKAYKLLKRKSNKESSKSNKGYALTRLSLSSSPSYIVEVVHEKSSKASRKLRAEEKVEDIKSGSSKSSNTSSTIDPEDEATWAEYTLSDVVAKGDKGMSIQSELQASKASKETSLVSSEFRISKASKFNDMSVSSYNYNGSKSSKSTNMSVSSYENLSSKAFNQSSKSSKSGGHPMSFTGSNSSDNKHSFSYSLSMQSSQANSEKGDSSLNSKNPDAEGSAMSGTTTVGSTQNLDTPSKSGAGDASTNQSQSSSASSRSLVAAFMLLLVPFAI